MENYPLYPFLTGALHPKDAYGMVNSVQPDQRSSLNWVCTTESLIHCILVDSSTVICWMSPFVIWRVSGLFVSFILFLMENPVGKQCRP